MKSQPRSVLLPHSVRAGSCVLVSTLVLVGLCALASTLVLAGCTAPSTNTGCPAGSVDVNGNCLLIPDGGFPPDGSLARDGGNPCGPSAKLVQHMCVLDPGALPGAVGAACNSDGDCIGGTSCAQGPSLPGGYCTVVGCGGRHPCPVGSLCYATNSTDTMCLTTCEPGVACRSKDYHCEPIRSGDVAVCMPSCTLTNACTAGTKCDSATGACVVDACDPKQSDPCKTSQTQKLCYADTSGSVAAGGFCVHTCDPSEPSACNLQHGDVCQPDASNPAHKGICSAAVCNTSDQCPGGSQCNNHACQPPPLCDSKGACADKSLGCIGGPGGQCMPKCPTAAGQSCADIQSSLQCYTKGTPALCLPAGSFPGSSCRASQQPCDAIAVGKQSVPMVCDQKVCRVECSHGGDKLCSALDKNGACAARGSVSECLTKGTFVGGACAAGNKCQALDTGGGRKLPMSCETTLGICLFDCSDGVPMLTTGKNDAYCAALDASLACARQPSAGTFPSDDVCLPIGSFAGGPCGPDKSCGVENGQPLACEDGTCLLTCASHNTCTPLGLVCGFGVYKDHDVCLPPGTFPGGPCGLSNSCAQALHGNPDLNMTCRRNVCFLQCDETNKWSGYGQALCQAQDPALTCSPKGGNLCVPACNGSGACGNTAVCFDPGTWPAHQNACLPKGSFVGAPCSLGQCEDLPSGTKMTCLTNAVSFTSSCYAQCTPDDPNTAANEDTCSSVDPQLICAHGYYPQDLCVPKGNFVGSPCVNGSCGNDDDSKKALTCEQGTCYITCTPGVEAGPPDSCIAIDPTQTCRSGLFSDPVCAARGSYEGGPCAVDSSNVESCKSVDLGGALGPTPMVCASHVCHYDCTGHDTPWCQSIKGSLSCQNNACY